MSNYVVNTERDYSTIASAVEHQRTIEHSVGYLRRTGVSWVAGWNYVSHYNWSIRNWEYLCGEIKIYECVVNLYILLNRVILFFILAGTFNHCMLVNTKSLSKYYLIGIVFIGFIYFINVIWNWYVYLVNGNRIHSHMFYVSDSILDRMNEFYEIPIHSGITDRQTLIVANQICALISQLIHKIKLRLQ